MIKEDHAIALFKIGKKKWMDKLIDGNINFSCCGKFIEEATSQGNIIQGDALEAIFAKLKIRDPRIQELRVRFGDDLEEIYIGEFVFFRRKSALLRPIFCLYGYKAKDLIEDNKIKRSGIQSLNQSIDSRMFEGFSNKYSMNNVLSDDERFQALLIDPRGFTTRFKEGVSYINKFNETSYIFDEQFKPMCVNRNMHFEMKPVNYSFYKKETFILNVTDNYEELFYKFPEYSYQREARICITNREFFDINKRYNLKTRKFTVDKDVFVISQPFKMQYVVSVVKK
jgi:hypothetical protein